MESKNVLASKTVWGGIIGIVLAPILKNYLHVEIQPDEQATLAETLANASGTLAAIGGFAMLLWGRFTAAKKVKILGS